MSTPDPLQSTISSLDLSISPTHCGYCGGQGSLSQGMWVERLTVSDYQALLDRGWRRSGRYVYKPCMSLTCCPLYTIRCKAGEYQPTKSQRKVVKRVQNFVKNGTKSKEDELATAKTTKNEAASNNVGEVNKSLKRKEKELTEENGKETSNVEPSQFKRVEGQRKAKTLRREKYLEKLIKSGKEEELEGEAAVPKNKPKHISALIPDQNFFALNQKILQSETDSAHKFELRLVKADLTDKHFMRSFHASYRVYRQYQTVVHNDKPQDCGIQTFAGFLCDSPLIYETKENKVLGAFHQQYLVDGLIVAVGVVDILPHSLSSVYLYYDPVWWGKGPNLSPGTYTAIREVQLTQQLDLPFYYMGFYIHSCPKMRYKGRFLPSDLLSPTLLSWHNIEHCLPQMEAAKYSTFADIPVTGPAIALPSMEVGRVRLCVRDRLTSYEEWKGEGAHSEEVEQYHALVGQHLAESLVLRWGESNGENDSDSEEDN
eukprot:GFUD01013474.1.p1 GENE.GFUD01013474.1~~GFUD01013474.1.p1  ORF type:complete len:485 (-),score=159.52 GFUD01013474.1:157-1611(-)